MTTFWYATLGGLAINFVRLFELQQTPPSERPDTFSDWLYCLQFFGSPFIGGFLAVAYQDSGTNVSPILAINIGVSAPLILKSFFASAGAARDSERVG